MQPDLSPARRPRLTPAIADIRRAVRAALVVPLNQNDGESDGSGLKAAISDSHSEKSVVFDNALVLVGLSGGADSLALAAATSFEAPRSGIRAGAVVVDHGLQEGSADVAARAAQQARDLGLDPVLVKRVVVPGGRVARAKPSVSRPGREGLDTLVPRYSSSGVGAGGPEAAAREARYGAFAEALAETGASAVLLAHTLDDQAETVLLGLARGSGAASLQGMAPQNGPYLRPLLGIRRAMTRQFCVDSRLEPWDDPQNLDPAYARVRVRRSSLPTLEADLGPGITEALARTAEQLREDGDALDAMIVETIEDICEHAEAGISVSVGALTANPPALRHRIIRYVAQSEFGVSLERVHTLAVARLVTDWHGQEALDLPGVRVVRQGGRVIFTRAAAGR